MAIDLEYYWQTINNNQKIMKKQIPVELSFIFLKNIFFVM